MSDEYTPREHGLEGGYDWATRFASSAAELEQVASGEIPAELRDTIEPAASGWRTWRSE